jgi:hypothetical protein
MFRIANRAVWFCIALSLMLVFCSCESGPRPPEKGSPAFLWQAAKESWTAGDFNKTLDHLDKLLVEKNEYSARALPWSLVCMSGLAKGYMELADHYEIGGRANKSDPSGFRKQVSNCRGYAGRLSMRIADKFGELQANKDERVPLAFPYPPGTASPVPQLDKVVRGMMIPEVEMDAAQKRALERGVLRAACRAAGAPDDSAKLQETLKAEGASVTRSVFMIAMADTLFEEAQLFGRMKLDQPEKLQILMTRAQDVLKSVPECKESKELSGKIQAELKKAAKKS